MSERQGDDGERDPFADLLGADAEDHAGRPDSQEPPLTRREARERERRRAAEPQTTPQRSEARRRRRWPVAILVTVIALALVGGGGAYAWSTFQPQLQGFFSSNESDDYTGEGSGEVTVTINEGDIGSDIATTLHKRGVTKSYSAFYSLLLAKARQPVFHPGVYSLKKHMSAQAALDALQDPDNRVSAKVTIPEGMTEAAILERLSDKTGTPLDELEKVAGDVESFGLPKQATTLEGFLFPATYTFDPEVSAREMLQRMVARAFTALDDAGVPENDRWRVVVLASIVQREAGPEESDFAKIARVFVNRIADDMPLQSDATITYGTGNTHTVWTSDDERHDEDNPYNTYVHKGLPPGPIGNPGDVAIKAALHPAPGDWLYFVTVNLNSGKTVFSSTYAEHEKAVEKLQEWCKEPDHAERCS